jgi:microcystin-dependent protein
LERLIEGGPQGVNMSDPYLGEIRTVPFNFAPAGWAICEGQTLSIAQNTALFSLVGTYYGGNGTSTFQLPDLRGRTLIHQGNGAVVGESGGVESVALTTNEIAAHTHGIVAQPAAGNVTSPAGSYLAGSADAQYAASGTGITAAVLENSTGSGTAHNNLQPYLCITYVIALEGIYPSRN